MGTISLLKWNANEIVYLVLQGQQPVVEVDGGHRDPIILAVISHSELQERQKLILTFIEALEIWEFKGQEGPLVIQINGRKLTYHGRRR